MNLLYKWSGEAVSYLYFLGSVSIPVYEFLKAPGGWGPQIHNPITRRKCLENLHLKKGKKNVARKDQSDKPSSYNTVRRILRNNIRKNG